MRLSRWTTIASGTWSSRCTKFASPRASCVSSEGSSWRRPISGRMPMRRSVCTPRADSLRSRSMRKACVAFVLAVAAIGACSDDAPTLPDAVAPASRHDALRAALTTDAKQLSFSNGDWLEDLGDAPFYGLAWYARREDLDADDAQRRD